MLTAQHLTAPVAGGLQGDEQSRARDAMRAKTLTEARGWIETILRRVSRREWGRTRAKRRIEIVLARFDVESRRTRDSRNGPRAAVTGLRPAPPRAQRPRAAWVSCINQL